VRFEADGRSRRTYRQIVQVLTQEAVDDWAEQEFSYAPGHQRLTVNWIRVVKPDGQVVSAKPSLAQDADVPATMGDPVYSDRKVRRFSLSGVAPGTLVDYSYTVEELKPYLPGDFLAAWSITTGHFTRRSRYIVDLPASLEPRVLERNSAQLRHVTTGAGRRVYTWTATDVPRIKPEPFAADSNGVLMSVALAAPMSWQGIAHWYAGLARDRYALTPALERELHELVARAHTAEDSLRAVHRWVAQDIRYVSIALGLGGYQPRAPQGVFETGYGDCKDKATLFIALVQRMGFTAYPVLLNAGGTVERSLPSIEQFDHAIAAVERPGGYLFVDLTSELTPLGQLPGPDQGEFALVVHPDGRGEEMTLPEDSAGANLLELRLTGELSADGFVTVHYTERALGLRQYDLRKLFTTPLDSTQRVRLMQAAAGAMFPGATGDSMQIFDGKDLTAEPKVSMVIAHAPAAKLAGSTAILTLPFGTMAHFKNLAADLVSHGPRRFPIDVARVIGPLATISELRLTLPDGWRAQLPKNVSATSVYGSYTAEYVQTGRELRVVRRLTGAVRGIEPAERVGALIDWLKAVAEDDVQYIVLEWGAGTGAGTGGAER
jgi:transglutaminase-like putative cysteine protease